MNDDHTFAPEMTAEEAVQMVLKRPEMYGLQKVAAVPDAATEERIERWMQLVGKGVEERMAAEAERDAALDAIERARAVCLHLGGINGDVSHPAPSYYVSVGRNVVATEVLAALDGAPEPEWEYGVRDELGGLYIVNRPKDPALKSGGYLRRRKAGPWLPAEGESK